MASSPMTKEQATLLPFGLYFRQTPLPSPVMKKGQTTREPEITTGDGNDPDKIDAEWYPDEDEEPDDPPDNEPKKEERKGT